MGAMLGALGSGSCPGSVSPGYLWPIAWFPEDFSGSPAWMVPTQPASARPNVALQGFFNTTVALGAGLEHCRESSGPPHLMQYSPPGKDLGVSLLLESGLASHRQSHSELGLSWTGLGRVGKKI